jgi:pimeloyl-ACP methyl ester carboxylesterase/DNA-binding CsgD family transcriptional regulator
MPAPLDPTLLPKDIRFARVSSGARIAWAKSGRGPPLVRVAHWMTHVEHDTVSPIWQPWLTGLGRHLEVIRYDERGCGLSGADTVPLGLEAALEELEAVVESAAHPRVALLGQSGAAAPAIAFAAKHPDRVSHLILLGGYLAGLMHANSAPETIDFHEAKVRLVELGWGRNDPAVQQFFTTTMIPDATNAQVAALNEQQRLSCDGTRAAQIMQARARLDVRALAPLLRCPTLVLHAAGDMAVPIERGREMAAAIPGARFETLATRNHIPLLGDGGFDRFIQVVIDFVAGETSQLALTPREKDLAHAVADGLDNLQIAARLGIAEKTARNALSALYAKLGVEGRPQAIVRLRAEGFGARLPHSSP